MIYAATEELQRTDIFFGGSGLYEEVNQKQNQTQQVGGPINEAVVAAIKVTNSFPFLLNFNETELSNVGWKRKLRSRAAVDCRQAELLCNENILRVTPQ